MRVLMTALALVLGAAPAGPRVPDGELVGCRSVGNSFSLRVDPDFRATLTGNGEVERSILVGVMGEPGMTCIVLSDGKDWCLTRKEGSLFMRFSGLELECPLKQAHVDRVRLAELARLTRELPKAKELARCKLGGPAGLGPFERLLSRDPRDAAARSVQGNLLGPGEARLLGAGGWALGLPGRRPRRDDVPTPLRREGRRRPSRSPGALAAAG